MNTLVSLNRATRSSLASAIAAAAVMAGSPLIAGSYAPAAGETGSTAIYKDDSAFSGWATKVVSYTVGTNVASEWKDTSMCLGAPGGNVYDITCLGNGGTIVVSFAKPIANGEGWDFAVFENAFSEGFLELAYVEVSSDGVNWVRFPNHCEITSNVGAYSTEMDPTEIDGLASKYMLDYGTPFDLDSLIGASGVDKVDLNWITQVRLVDIVGDGKSLDSDGNKIYDPYPTTGSGGFDLDAVGVRYYATAETPQPSISISGSVLTIKWQGIFGANYKLQTSTDLKTWNDVETGIAGTTGEMSRSLTVPSIASFYRVVLE